MCRGNTSIALQYNGAVSWSRLLTVKACKLQSGSLALATTTRAATRLEGQVKAIINNV
jgi:hypothetical protein